MPTLEESWEEATAGLDRDVCDKWFTKLQESYSEERRTYHNLDYLRDILASFYEIKDNLKQPQAVLLAIFFQNFLYNPKGLDNDDNVKQLNSFMDEAGVDENGQLRLRSSGLLIDVTLNVHLTDAHKIGSVFGGEDGHYFLDLDMVPLGSPPEQYAEYREKVRGEYSFLSEPMYTALRLKVLQNFLQIPNIFATAEFREKYEEQARKNIQDEIAMYC